MNLNFHSKISISVVPFLVTVLQINVQEEYILNIFRGFKLARIGKMARHNNSLRLVFINSAF